MKGTKRKKRSAKRGKPEKAFVVKLLPRKLLPILKKKNGDRHSTDDNVNEEEEGCHPPPDGSNNNSSSSRIENDNILDRDCITPDRIRLDAIEQPPLPNVVHHPAIRKKLRKPGAASPGGGGNTGIQPSLAKSITFRDCAMTR